MRIAYLINQYPKVSHSFIRREIRALERRGIEVVRIALRGWDGEVADDEDKDECRLTRYVLRDGASALIWAAVGMLLKRPGRLFSALRLAFRMSCGSERPLLVHLIYLAEACRVRHWVQAAGVTHLHAHFGTNAAEVSMLVNELGGPSWSFTVHGPEEFDKPYALGLPEKLSRCNFVVAISSYGRSQLFRYMKHADWAKVQVVHCGLESSFHVGAASSPPNIQRFVCVGRLCEQKGQLLLVEALRILAERGRECELVFAGDGELRQEIEVLIERYGLSNRVRITGWISSGEVRREILAARALVLPSFAEGLPVVIMEAMALRRPVISTYVAGIPELVLPGIHGWLAAAGDVEGLVQAMVACLDATAEAIGQMGEAARRRALDRHDVDVEAAKLAALIGRFQGPMPDDRPIAS